MKISCRTIPVCKSKIRTYWLRHANYDILSCLIKTLRWGEYHYRVCWFNLQFHMNLSGNIDGLELGLK
ncbi:hypothetical protein CS542_03345 [Pedobacter sp. IW39]|nr:hypothetical protein CS542_03345 [Pedobacter sp. IW39]